MSYFDHIEIVQHVRPGHVQLREVVGHIDKTCWLLDGAPEIGGMGSRPPHDVRWFITQTHRELTRTLIDHPEFELADVVREVSNRIQARYRAMAETPKRMYWPAASLAMARYFRRQGVLFWFLVGNAALAIGNPRANRLQTFTDERLGDYAGNHFAEVYLLQKAGIGFSHPEFQNSLEELVRHERATLNVKDTHYLLLPEHFDLSWGRTGVASIAPDDEVFLLSEGAQRHLTPFELSPDMRTLCGRLAAGQGAKLVTEIRQAEAMDPEGYAFPRLTPFDDVTFVRVHPSEPRWPGAPG